MRGGRRVRSGMGREGENGWGAGVCDREGAEGGEREGRR